MTVLIFKLDIVYDSSYTPLLWEYVTTLIYDIYIYPRLQTFCHPFMSLWPIHLWDVNPLRMRTHMWGLCEGMSIRSSAYVLTDSTISRQSVDAQMTLWHVVNFPWPVSMCLVATTYRFVSLLSLFLLTYFTLTMVFSVSICQNFVVLLWYIKGTYSTYLYLETFHLKVPGWSFFYPWTLETPSKPRLYRLLSSSYLFSPFNLPDKTVVDSIYLS